MIATEKTVEYVKELLSIINELRQEIKHTTQDAIERGREIDRLARLLRLAHDLSSESHVRDILKKGL